MTESQYEEEVMSVEFFGGIGRGKLDFRKESVFLKRGYKGDGSVDRNYGSVQGNG